MVKADFSLCARPARLLHPGRDGEEAIEMAKEAIELHLEALRDDGESAPDDRIEVMIVKVEVPAA